MTTHRNRIFRSMAALLAASMALTAAPMPARAQMNSVGRGLNLNVGPRISPNLHLSPNLHYDATVGDRIPDDSGAAPKKNTTPRKTKGSGKGIGKGGNPPSGDGSYVSREVLVEVAGTPGDDVLQDIARRHRLTRLQSFSFTALGTTLARWRINDDRSVDAVVQELGRDGGIKAAQRNTIFRLQESAGAKPAAGPEQYALAILHLPQAQGLSLGENVRVAVIDSGIDAAHPEIAGSIVSAYDALGSSEGPHAHGTSVAGIIVAHGALKGAAPSVQLLAIRAFGEKKSGAESTSFLVLKSLDYAIANGAKIINMSFAGPHDDAIERGLAVAAGKGIVLIAAAGNGGPKSAPLYPGADRNVIAVTATDSSEHLFAQANQGGYVAIAAPGVDVLAPLPGGKYGVSSGTSLSAAYVTGIAALMIARNPALQPDDVRLALATSARDLGSPGRDDQFGAGEADALAAVSSVVTPISTASERSASDSH